MKRVAHIISLLLLVTIAMTAQSAAVARTMSDASGQMVICTGTGPMMVYFDENGEPTGPPQICPDYALSLIVAVGLPNLKIAAKGTWHNQRVVLAKQNTLVLQLGTPKARGPPILI